MLDTSTRLLHLLVLLQTRRDWTAPALADRLEVTTRTVRRDIDRLRELGYPVHTSMGPAGGYRLGAGASLPPLLLDDEEAVAVAVGLRTAGTGAATGMGEVAIRALAKLEQVLPSRLQYRVNSLNQATVAVPGRSTASVDPAVLTTISTAIRACEMIRVDYVNHHGTASRRTLEPHRLAIWGHRWYLVCWDRDRADWRTFRVDRISPCTPNGPRFTPREPPDGDVAAYLRRTIGFDMWPYRVRVKLHCPATQITGRVDGIITPIDEHTCVLELASDSFELAALVVGMLDVDFEAQHPPELAQHLRKLSARFAAATGS